MFHYHFKTKKIKQRPHPKAFYEEYIDIGSELTSRISSDPSNEIEAMLHGNVRDMRREFRRTNKRNGEFFSNKDTGASVYETESLARVSLIKGNTVA